MQILQPHDRATTPASTDCTAAIPMACEYHGSPRTEGSEIVLVVLPCYIHDHSLDGRRAAIDIVNPYKDANRGVLCSTA
eukprot:SAG31_NODE_4942_length_2846_cov_1.892246_2_plen_79_part_00